MAITIPIVSEFRDAGLKKAQKDIDSFSSRMEKRLGGMGMAAVGASAAVGSFALKAVMDFKNLALEAGKFADATGIAIEDASRWIEVSGDFGISATSIQGAIQKMNRALADGKPVFDAYNVEVVRTADGMVDANKTFQNAITTIGAIEDPTLRAKAAQEVFGKSYGEIANLMELSAKDLATALADVSDQKIMTPEERKQADRLRVALDNLKDAGEDLSLTLGSRLVPAFAVAAEAAAGFLNKLEELREDEFWGPFLRSLPEWLNWYKEEFKDTFGIESTQTIDAHAESFVTLDEALGMVESRVSEADYTKLQKELGDTRGEVDGLNTALDILRGEITDREVFRKFDETMWYIGNTFNMSQEQADEFGLAILDMVEELDGIPPETEARIVAAVEMGDFLTVKALLDEFRRGVDVPIRQSPTNRGLPIVPRAMGGPVTGGSPYVVGERGPELFVPANSGRIVPNHAMGGDTINVTIQTSADPNEVARAIETYRRRNGALRV